MSQFKNDWRKQAFCATLPTVVDKAFGDSEDEDEYFDTEDAEWFRDYVCYECPVMVQCKAWVDKFPQTHGVFGGTLPSERNVLDTDSSTT